MSGTTEAYIDTFPEPSRARRVTTGGAALQVDFRSDGKELFILAADGDRPSLLERVGYRSPSLTLVDNWRAQIAP